MSNLVRLSKINTIKDFPFRSSTLYKWHARRKYPELFTKIGGSVFVVLRILDEIVEKNRGKASGSDF